MSSSMEGRRVASDRLLYNVVEKIPSVSEVYVIAWDSVTTTAWSLYILLLISLIKS